MKPSPTPAAIRPAVLAVLAQSVVVLRWAPLATVAALALLGDTLLPELAPGAQRAVINVWVQLIIMIVAAVISYALAPKPPDAPRPSLEDLTFPTAEEGRAIPVVFGTVWVTGPNVLWYGDLSTVPIKSGGGKK